MFWGLIMEPNKRYTQTVEKPFHISQAAMDTSTGDGEVCQVMVVVDGKNFLICTLQKGKTIQVPLDLYFKTGNIISFLTNGKCNVHLTGYLDPEFDEDEDDEDEDDEEEEAPELVPAKNKRKLDSSTESATKKLKQETKKLMKQQLDSSRDSDEEDSSDDDGGDDLQKLLSGDVDSDENDESFRPNSTGADSDEESGEEEEEAEEEEESQEEAETSKQEEPVQLSRSAKKKLKKLRKQQEQQQQQQQQPQTNGVEKKKKKEQQSQPEKKQKGKESVDNKQAAPEKKINKTVSGGVQIEDLKVGSGAIASAGKEVEVYYEGRLKQNNKMFDNCKKGAGFRFRVGHKEVITGWDVGIAGMKVGGKRKIVCPPNMAYGAKGSPPVIPPNSTLVFEVELRKVK